MSNANAKLRNSKAFVLTNIQVSSISDEVTAYVCLQVIISSLKYRVPKLVNLGTFLFLFCSSV